ncbi:MAG: hypothetical protein ACKVT1_13520 [Dehalococcoidia bacterium]
MVQVRPDPLNGKPFTREMLTPELMDAVFGTPQESAARTRLFKANMRKAEDARADFPGEYIVVIGCKVVAHAARIEEVREQLRQKDLFDVEGTAIAPPLPPRL